MSRHELRLRHLTFFKAVSDVGSFTAAAASCKVSQPALSSAIRQFEDELGARLFERTTRRVTLTRFGRALLPLADAILTNAELASRDIQTLVTSERLTVRVAATPSMAMQRLPSLMRRFAVEFPNVKVVVHDVPNPALARYVRDGEVDLGIGIAPFDANLFETHPLFFDQLAVICSKEHRLYGEPQIPWAWLRDEPIVTFQPTSNVYQIAARIFADLGMVFRPDTFNYHLSVLGMAAQNLAVAILPSRSADELVHMGLRQIPLVEPVGRRRYNLIARRNRQLLKPARILAERIIAEFSDSEKLAPRSPTITSRLADAVVEPADERIEEV